MYSCSVVVGTGIAPPGKGRELGGHLPEQRGRTLGISGSVCYNRKARDYCGARQKDANVAEVEAVLQVFLQELAEPAERASNDLVIVYDSNYAFTRLSGDMVIDKNGGLVGVARVSLAQLGGWELTATRWKPVGFSLRPILV